MKYNAFISYSHGADADLAPGLERALEKFAKPTFKRRALRIFRDSNDLSISPDLWGKIEEGLKESEYLVYCASAASAKSFYCNKEVEYWLANKSMDNFLLVITDGELAWDFQNNDFDWEKTTAVPKLLSKAFKNEPLYVDFRGEIPKGRMNLNDVDFKSKLIYIAATLHKKPVGDMVGEGIKQHKRTLRIRNTALTVVFSLMTIAMVLMVSSIKRRIASQLHFQAKSLVAEDPSIALRVEQAALKRYDFSEFRNTALSIIANNNFYKVLEKNDSTYVADFAMVPQDSSYILGYKNGYVGFMDSEGNKTYEFKAHDDEINAIALSHDGRSFATASYEPVVKLWNLQGELISELPGHNERVNQVVFSPNGNEILTACSDGLVRMFKLNGELLGTNEGFEFGVEDVEFAADGKSLLATSGGMTSSALHLWSIDGLDRTQWTVPWMTASALSPDGETIITGQSEGTVTIRKTYGDIIAQYQGPEGAITSISFSADGKTYLTGHANGDGQERDELGKLVGEFKGHPQPISKIKYTPGGGTVITASFDGTVRSWALDRVEKGAVQEFAGLEKWIDNIAITGNGKYILAADENGTAFIWDAHGDLIDTLDDPEFKVGPVQFLQKGKSLLILNKTGAAARSYDLGSGEFTEKTLEFPYHYAMAISADGNSAFLRAPAMGGELWDLESNTSTTLDIGTGISSAAFSPDGTRLLIGGNDSKARLYDLQGNFLSEFDAQRSIFVSSEIYAVGSVAFSPDGETIAMGSAKDGNIRIAAVRGRVLADIKGHEDTVSDLAFSPDGKSVLSVSYDKTAKLWDLRGTLLSDYGRQTGEVSAMAFDPDGKGMLVGNTKGKVQMIQFIEVEDFLDNYVQPLNKEQRELYEVD